MTEVASVLYGREDIRRRVEELGRAITGDYAGREPVLISVLKGGTMFLADLMRQLPLPLEIHFMAISRYGDAEESLGRVQILLDLDVDPAGRDVLLVEDIVDTGLTLTYLLSVLRARGPASIQVCALLDKAVRRIAPLSVRYAGFDCPDRFVVGYGLDFAERYRNLADIFAVDDLKALREDPLALVPLLSAPLRLPVLEGPPYSAGEPMIEMELTGVRVELPTNQPIVLLRERGGERYLPIWIGAAEAAAIALSLQGVQTPRPMTHDLMKTMLEDLAVQVQRIVVTELRESTYYATIHLERAGENFEISSRPSDAIALAVRMAVPIFAQEDVLAEASILIPGDEEEEVEKFREFLDNVRPEDFDG